MNGDVLADGIMDSEYPSGPVLVHVVDYDHEYWLEVVEVRTTTLIETGWVNGTVIETRPIAEGVRARREVFTPRPYFRPEFIAPPEGPVELPAEFRDPEPETGPAPDPRSDLPPFQSLVGKHITVRIPIIGEVFELSGASPDAAERVSLLPDGVISGIIHTPLHGRVNEDSEISDSTPSPLIGHLSVQLENKDQLFANPHMDDPKPDQSEPHYQTAREFSGHITSQLYDADPLPISPTERSLELENAENDNTNTEE